MIYAIIILGLVVLYLVVLTWITTKTVIDLYDDVEVLKKTNADLRDRAVKQFFEVGESNSDK